MLDQVCVKNVCVCGCWTKCMLKMFVLCVVPLSQASSRGLDYPHCDILNL